MQTVARRFRPSVQLCAPFPSPFWPIARSKRNRTRACSRPASKPAFRQNPYLRSLFAASAAIFSSLFTCSNSSLAFAAWPPMSHSFASCAALIFSNAWSDNRCAAARFGCFFPLTFSTGFCPKATPPPMSAAHRTAPIRLFDIFIRNFSSQDIVGPSNEPKPGIVGGSCTLILGLANTQDKPLRERGFQKVNCLSGRYQSVLTGSTRAGSQHLILHGQRDSKLFQQTKPIPDHRGFQYLPLCDLIDGDPTEGNLLVGRRHSQKFPFVRPGDRPVHHQFVVFGDGFIHHEFQVRQSRQKPLHLPPVGRRAHSPARNCRVFQRVRVRYHLLDVFQSPFIPHAVVQAPE